MNISKYRKDRLNRNLLRYSNIVSNMSGKLDLYLIMNQKMNKIASNAAENAVTETVSSVPALAGQGAVLGVGGVLTSAYMAGAGGAAAATAGTTLAAGSAAAAGAAAGGGMAGGLAGVGAVITGSALSIFGAVVAGISLVGYISGAIAWGQQTALDDINYFNSQLKAYIQEWGSTGSGDNTYTQNKAQIDLCVKHCDEMSVAYSKIEKIPEELKELEGLSKTNPKLTAEKLEDIQKRITAHSELCDSFLEELRSINQILIDGKHWLGKLEDNVTWTLNLNWLPYMSTFADKLRQTLVDLEPKLEPHFRLLKELSLKLKEITSKMPKPEDLPSTAPIPATETAPKASEEELKKTAIKAQDATSKEDYTYADVDGKKERYIAWNSAGEKIGIFAWSETSPITTAKNKSSTTDKPVPTTDKPAQPTTNVFGVQSNFLDNIPAAV